MGKRRSMMRAKKYDVYKRPTIKPWSDLNHDVLSLIMMKIGLVDLKAFSSVCKSWRSLALSNKNKFIVSRPPMSISIILYNIYAECDLEDLEGRKFKFNFPYGAGETCAGITCGYFILFRWKTRDFWLVNPFIKHRLHFPDVPTDLKNYLDGILVFSPSISEWVFVILDTNTPKIWFSIAGEREWTYVSTPVPIDDLIAFKGKVYTIHSSDQDGVRLWEMKLYPEPMLVLLETKNFLKSHFSIPRFMSSGENLYVIDQSVKYPHKIHEIDLDKMELVSREKEGKNYSFFLTNVRSQSERYVRYR